MLERLESLADSKAKDKYFQKRKNKTGFVFRAIVVFKFYHQNDKNCFSGLRSKLMSTMKHCSVKIICPNNEVIIIAKENLSTDPPKKLIIFEKTFINLRYF